MADIDADLAVGLKAAKGKKMFFAFIPKGGGDGKLIVSKTKIPPKDIAAAKKEIGGGAPVTGKCFGPTSDMAFFVAKPVSGSMDAAVKKVAKRDAGLGVVATFQVAQDADADEADAGAPGAAPPPAAAPAAPGQAAAPAAPAQPNVLGLQKALQKLGYNPGNLDGVVSPDTQAAIRQFQQASGLAADGMLSPQTQAALAKALRGGGPAPAGANGTAAAASGSPAGRTVDFGKWIAAKQNGINQAKALAAKVAGTKHELAADVLKEINAIIGFVKKLPDKPAPEEIDKLSASIRQDDGIAAAEEIADSFAKVEISSPMLDALQGLRQ
jgi:hypothetical protein